MKRMHIEENDDGSFSTESTAGPTNGPYDEREMKTTKTKESHANAEELADHVKKHFKSKSPKEKRSKRSDTELNRKFMEIVKASA